MWASLGQRTQLRFTLSATVFQEAEVPRVTDPSVDGHWDCFSSSLLQAKLPCTYALLHRCFLQVFASTLGWRVGLPYALPGPAYNIGLENGVARETGM